MVKVPFQSGTGSAPCELALPACYDWWARFQTEPKSAKALQSQSMVFGRFTFRFTLDEAQW
jgi:hypothetical protein